MIKSLSKLTMRQYIELVCGDVSVLTGKGEIAAPAQLQKTRKRIIFEYARLSDNAGSKIFLSDHAMRIKAKAELVLFQCLNNALALGAFDEVRGVMKEYGIAKDMDDNQVSVEVTRLLKRAKTNVKRHEQEQMQKDDEKEPTADEIRIQFDRQAASLMTYFKFQIDFDTMPASQFACMVDQAHKQINAQMAAMSKK
ncbi:MAG: hypothetical protein NC421_07560 [Lachnospiraceae bacterium]|nr:hypothetical protein [Lachnospiraceae bacterium]